LTALVIFKWTDTHTT